MGKYQVLFKKWSFHSFFMSKTESNFSCRNQRTTDIEAAGKPFEAAKPKQSTGNPFFGSLDPKAVLNMLMANRRKDHGK